MAWYRREHGRLVAAVLHSRILYTDALLLNYAAHACWEATASTAVVFQMHGWRNWLRIAAARVDVMTIVKTLATR